MTAKINEFIASDAADKYGKPKEERIARYKEFCANALRIYGRAADRPGQRKLTFSHIPAIIDITGTTFKELLNELGVQVDWPNEMVASTADCLEQMSEKDQKDMLDLCRRLVPGMWLTEFMLGTDSTRRVREFYTRNYTRQEKVKFMEGLPDGMGEVLRGVLADNYFATRLPFDILPVVATALGLPLKWTFGFDESMPVMTRSLIVDNCMSLYMLLPQSYKELVNAVINDRIAGKKVKM